MVDECCRGRNVSSSSSLLSLSPFPHRRAHAVKAREALLARWIFRGATEDPGWAGEPLKAHLSCFWLIQHAPVWELEDQALRHWQRTLLREIFFFPFLRDVMGCQINTSTHDNSSNSNISGLQAWLWLKAHQWSSSLIIKHRAAGQNYVLFMHKTPIFFFPNLEATTASKCTATSCQSLPLKTIASAEMETTLTT